MRRRTPAFVFVALLAGCGEKKSESAQAELKIIEDANGSASELCSAHRKLSQAYLEEHNAEGYRYEKSRADANCLYARLGVDDPPITDNIQ